MDTNTTINGKPVSSPAKEVMEDLAAERDELARRLAAIKFWALHIPYEWDILRNLTALVTYSLASNLGLSPMGLTIPLGIPIQW